MQTDQQGELVDLVSLPHVRDLVREWGASGAGEGDLSGDCSGLNARQESCYESWSVESRGRELRATMPIIQNMPQR